MSRNVLDPSQWVNPQLGNMVLTAMFAPLPAVSTSSYRPLGMSARELLESVEWGRFEAHLSADRTEVVVSLDLTIKGNSSCMFGYLETKLQYICSFWSGKCFYEKWDAED